MKRAIASLLLLMAVAAAAQPFPFPPPLIRPRQFRNDGAERISRSGQSDLVNYLRWSEAFDNVVWSSDVSGATITITANAATAPDGTPTADRMQCDATTGAQLATKLQQWAFAAPAVSSPTTCSVYIYGNGASGTTDICLYDGIAWMCGDCAFTNGAWSRCSTSDAVGAVTTARYCKVGNNSNQNGGVGRSAVDTYIWGAQGEPNPAPTPYQPTF